MISHTNNDHVGGLLGIEPNIRIRKLISNRKDLSTKLPAQLCTYNKDWNWDGVEFRFLQSALDYSPENNNSCMLQIRSKVGRVLLSGGIESEAEAQLERSYGRELTSEVLLAPHHGNITLRVMPSSSASSRASWCSNSFGHPHGRVVTRYGEFASKTLKTAQSGMISFEFSEEINKNGAQMDQIIHISQYRKRNSRYWY